MTITKNTSYANTTYYPGRKIKYIVIHYTAGSTSKTGSAYNTAERFKDPSVGGSADFIVDDTQVVQFNPNITSYYCWHAGVDYSNGAAPYWGKCTNANSIGIEICSTNPNYSINDKANSPKWKFTDAVIETAVELTKYLMQHYNVPISNVIRHWDVCYKECPGIIGWNPNSGSETKWQNFKAMLSGNSTVSTAKTTSATPESTMYRVQCGAFSVKSNADKLVNDLHKKGYKDSFAIKVNGGISDILYRVQCGAFSVKDNAENLKKKLYSDGYKDAFIITNTAKKSNTEIAKEVIAGKWGNGKERVQRLTSAGYNASAVQGEVNRLMR